MLFYGNLAEFVDGEGRKLQLLASANIPEVGVVLDVLGPSDDQDIDMNPDAYSVTQPVDRLAIDCNGIAQDRHRGITRRATGREAELYASSCAKITNRRQILAVSPADCDELSRRLDVEVTPQLLGANLVIGREDGADFSLSAIPQNTYCAIASEEAVELPRPPVATLVHYVQQKGCSRTGRAIAHAHGNVSLTRRFVANSKDHRGILCSVEYPVDALANIQRGQKVFFRFPMGRCN